MLSATYRLQSLPKIRFAWLVALHYLLAVFTVGQSCFITTLEGAWQVTKRDVYRRFSAF